MRASFQQCDFKRSWDMYKIVCQCVQTLNMHNIDQSLSNTLMNPELLSDEPDHHRQGLWALVLVDLFFRLLHDKPAIMTANLTEWRVNLPWLSANPESTEHVVPTLVFIVKSRLTFLLLRFFEIFDQDKKDKNSAIKHVTGLCTEIEDLFEEWSVVSLSPMSALVRFPRRRRRHWLRLGNPITLTGHTTNRETQ